MNLRGRNAIITVIAALLMIAVARADNDPGTSVQIIFDGTFPSPHNPTGQIGGGIRIELAKRGSTRSVDIAESIEALGPKAEGIRIAIIESDWAVQKAFSIPYHLNRYRNAHCLKVNVWATKRDGSIFADLLIVKKEIGAEAQFPGNDCHDPDLQIEHSRMVCVENEIATEMVKKSAKKLAPIIE